MSEEPKTDEAPESLVFQCELSEPPERVYRALTVSELLAAWLMPNDFRAEVGARFTFRPDAEAATQVRGPVECEVLALEPPHLVRYRWRERPERDAPDERAREVDSVVTFALSRTTGGGTLLRLVHDGGAAQRDRIATHFPRPKLAASNTCACAGGSLRWAA